MSDDNPVNVDSPIPRAIGFMVCFVTMGIGVLRSVEPTEIVTRSLVAGAVSWVVVKWFRGLLYQMSEDALNTER